jgi:hypothetical protein
MTVRASEKIDERLKLRAEIVHLREANRRLQDDLNYFDKQLKLARTAGISDDTADKIAEWINEKHKAATIDMVRKAVITAFEECANVAENEGEPEGEMPIELYGVHLEAAIRATIKATKRSIATRIRALKDILLNE